VNAFKVKVFFAVMKVIKIYGLTLDTWDAVRGTRLKSIYWTLINAERHDLDLNHYLPVLFDHRLMFYRFS